MTKRLQIARPGLAVIAFTLWGLGARTTYQAVPEGEGGARVLRADSANANRALLHRSRFVAPTEATVSWRWKVAAPLLANRAERRRSGDDYAARVFVVYETSLVPLHTVAINYVWAAHEPAGSVYPSPYTSRVRVIVLRSGAGEAGSWCDESRDVLRDYREVFGREPTEINGVAIMVDTDNTNTRATAWFDALHWEINYGTADSNALNP